MDISLYYQEMIFLFKRLMQIIGYLVSFFLWPLFVFSKMIQLFYFVAHEYYQLRLIVFV